MTKLVAIDVDGTLITKELQIPPRTQAAIAAARTRGVRFAIVTGRMYQSAAPFARALGLDGMPLVAYNGGYLAEYPSGRELFHQPVSLPVAQRLAAFCRDRGYHLQAYVDDQLFVEEWNQLSQGYAAKARVEAHVVGPLTEWLTRPSTKLMILSAPERLPAIQAEVEALLGAEAEAVSSQPGYLEVMSRGVSKELGLKKVAEMLGVDRAEVMAIGDGMNDITMLRWAGCGVAVGHAPAELKAVAAYVTEAGPGDAVAEALAWAGLA